MSRLNRQGQKPASYILLATTKVRTGVQKIKNKRTFFTVANRSDNDMKAHVAKRKTHALFLDHPDSQAPRQASSQFV
jgi:hypothetical protein